MAIAFAEVVTHNRRAGHSAVAAAAYRSRSRLVDARTGEIHDYTGRADELEKTSIVMPRAAQVWLDNRRAAGMGENEIRSALWNEAESVENRYDARVSRDLTVALPWELTEAQRARVSHEIARLITDEHAFVYEREWMENRQRRKEIVPMQGHGIAVGYAIHRPHLKANELNYHTHFLLSTRRMNAHGFTEKARELDNENLSGPHIDAWRQGIAGIVNRALERAGYDESHFIDMRSYERQGLDREGQIHMGPEAAALERRGIRTDVGDHNRDVRSRNEAREREAKRQRLSGKANVIDFEEKLAARERRRRQEFLMRENALREGRMKDALTRQKQIEEELKRKRDVQWEEEQRRREQDEMFDRDAYHQAWQEQVDQAGIDADAKRRSVGNQWQIHAVDPERERQAKEALRQKRQAQVRAFQERTPEDQRPAKLSPQFDQVKDKLPDNPRLRQAWHKHQETARQYAEIDEWANQRRAETQSRRQFELINLDWRHSLEKDLKEAELSKLYGDARREVEKSIQAIEARQDRSGLFYRMTDKRRDEQALVNHQKTLENIRWREDEARQTYQNVHKREREAMEQRYTREREIDEQRIEQARKTGRIPEPRFREMSPVDDGRGPRIDKGASPGREDPRRKRDRPIPEPPKPELVLRPPSPGGSVPGLVRRPLPASQTPQPDRSPAQNRPDFLEPDAEMPAPKPNREPGGISGAEAPDFLDDDKMAEGRKQEIKQYGEDLTRQPERGHTRGADFSC